MCLLSLYQKELFHVNTFTSQIGQNILQDMNCVFNAFTGCAVLGAKAVLTVLTHTLLLEQLQQQPL